MSDNSRIEWTDATWNPVTGCSKVSEGCRNCYAERVSHCSGTTSKPWTYANAAKNVKLHPERLDQPIRWRRPRRIFVNSMSDLFHEQVPDSFLDDVFGIMLACEIYDNRNHTFQILTKRPERMKAYLSAEPAVLVKRWARAANGIAHCMDEDTLVSDLVYGRCARLWSAEGRALSDHKAWSHCESVFPLPNVWLGVSAENQRAAEERVPFLLQTPAAVRFLSCEPLLGSLDLGKWIGTYYCSACGFRGFDGGEADPENEESGDQCPRCGADGWYFTHAESHGALDEETRSPISWIVAGGESGPNARPMHPDWVRSSRDQCAEAGVPFLFKQWGEWFPRDQWKHNPDLILPDDDAAYRETSRTHLFEDMSGSFPVHRVGKKAAGRVLDGRTWNEMPAVTR